MKIYMITNTKTGMRYIGKTINSLNQRFHKHCSNKNGLHNIIKKYGKKNFSIELLENVRLNRSSRAEMFWIEKLNTGHPFGYNMYSGGDSGYKSLNKKKTKEISIKSRLARDFRVTDQHGKIYDSLTEFCLKNNTSIDNFHRYKKDDRYFFNGFVLKKVVSSD